MKEGKIIDELRMNGMNETTLNKLEELRGLKESEYNGEWPIYTFEYNNGDIY